MKSLFRSGNWKLTVCLVAVGLGYLYFAFLPTKAEIERLCDDLKAKQADVTEAQRLQLAIHEIESDLELAREYQERWKPRWHVDPGSVMAEISDQIDQAGVRTVQFDPQPTIPFETMQQTRLVLGTEGSFSSVFKMLTAIEALDAMIWVDEFRISAPANDATRLSSEVSLAIFTVNPEISD